MSQISEFYASYRDAVAACGAGYNDHDLADVVVTKTRAIAANPTEAPLTSDPTAILTTAIASAAASGSFPVRVLDFGGAAGTHYFYSKHLLPDINIKWSVVETQSLVDLSSNLLSSENLSFFSSIPEALANLDGCDIVFSSGAIQYHPAPEDALDELVGIGAKDLVIARFPLFDGIRTVGVQTSKLSENGPGPLPQNFNDRIVRYPITFCTKALVAEKLLSRYVLNAQFLSPSANYSIGGKIALGMTLLLRLKDKIK